MHGVSFLSQHTGKMQGGYALVARAALGRAHEAVLQQEREAISNEGSVARVSLSPCTGKSSDYHLV
jgi:hypothetical protein